MENVNSPFGGKPFNTLVSAAYSGKVNSYTTSASDGQIIYSGDFVRLTGGSDANGIPYVAQANATDDVLGAVVGIRKLFTNEQYDYRPANTVLEILVTDDTYTQYEIQVNGNLDAVQIGQQANLIANQGNIYTGISAMQLDNTSIGTNSGQFLIIDLIQRTDNFLGDFAKVRCMILKHPYKHPSGNDYWQRNALTDTILPKTPTDNLYIGGKLTVDGAIDPTALSLSPQNLPPISTDGSMYYDNDASSFMFREGGIWRSLSHQLNIVTIAADFPTLAQVFNGYEIAAGANVTDNDPTKTNTGQSFTEGQTAFWNGTKWSLYVATQLWTDNGTDYSKQVASRNVNFGSGGLIDANMTAPVLLSDLNNSSFNTQNLTIIGAVNEVNTGLGDKANDGSVVHLSGSETITGTKIFSAAPTLSYATASTALVLDATNIVQSSSTTATELSYVHGVTSAIQTQLNAKEPTITGGTTSQWWRGDKTFQALPAASTSQAGIVQLSNSYAGTSQTLAVTEKALKDGLASVAPTGGYWSNVGTYLVPTTGTFGVKSLTYFNLDYTTVHATSTLSITDAMTAYNSIYDPTYVLGHSIVGNGYYDSVTSGYIFYYSSMAAITAGTVRNYSLGGIYDYYYYDSTATTSATIAANYFYNAYKNPTSAYFYSLFKWDNHAITGNSSLVPTVTGTVTILPYGFASFPITGNNYLTYNISTLTNFTQTGCIRFNLISHVSTGFPPRVFTYISKEAGSEVNEILLCQFDEASSIPGEICCFVIDSGGHRLIVNHSFGRWYPIAGKVYEFALDVDINTGNTRLFIDGVQFGAASGGTGTRSTDIGLLRIGNDEAGSASWGEGFSIANFVIYNALQFAGVVSSYTPGYTLESVYATQYYEGGLNSFQTYSNRVEQNLMIGSLYQPSASNLYRYVGASFNNLSRTSAVVGITGPIPSSLITFNGYYNSSLDLFNFRTDGTNAFGSVTMMLPPSGSFPSSNPITNGGLTTFYYKTASAYDVTITSSQIITQGTAIKVGNLTTNITAIPGGGATGPICSNEYNAVFHATHTSGDSVALPAATILGQSITIMNTVVDASILVYPQSVDLILNVTGIGNPATIAAHSSFEFVCVYTSSSGGYWIQI